MPFRNIFPLTIFAGILFFILQYHHIFIGIDHYDEGIILYGASNLLRGNIPYRDFYFLYPPGYIYFISLVFKFFGESIIHARMATLLVQSLSISLVFYLSQKIYSFTSSVITLLLLCIFISSILALSIPLCLLTCIIYLHYVEKQKNMYLFLCGICAGCISFFRLDFSIYVIASICITEFIRWTPILKKSYFQFFTKTYLLFCGLFLGFLPLFIIAYTIGFGTVFDRLLITVKVVSEFRKLPYPSLIPQNPVLNLVSLKHYIYQISVAIPFYLPYLVILLTWTGLYSDYRIKKIIDNLYTKLLLSLCLLLFTFYTQYRSDLEHLLPLYPFIFILLPSAIKNLYLILIKINLKKSSIVITLVTSTIFLFSMFQLQNTKLNMNIKDLQEIKTIKAKSVFYHTTNDPGYDTLIEYLINNTTNNDYLFIGSNRHDIVYINDITLYFITGRRSATAYWWYDPGVQTTAKIQNEMITQIEKTQPKYSILWTKASMTHEKNKGANSSHIYNLDTYISSHYTKVKIFGDYIVLKRN